MPDRVSIPASIEEARAALDGLGALLTAKQWERAAIVYAFTKTVGRGGNHGNDENSSLTIAGFAALGIAGLTTRDTVSLYRAAWKSAMDDGAPDAKPGDDVELPNLPWKDHFGEQTEAVRARVARAYLANNTDALKQIIRDHADAALAIADQVVSTPAVRAAVEHRLASPIEPRYAEEHERAAKRHDYHADLVKASGLIAGLMRAIESGDWTPTGTEQALLHALAGLITNQTEGDSADLFADIDRFLLAAR